MLKNLILCFTLLFLTFSAIAQVDKIKARQLAQDAVKIMDEGKIDEAIVMLKQAEQLDPTEYNYPYEIAYAYNAKKEYPKALEIMKKVVTYNNISDRCYQMLGNLYDMTGDSVNALKAYRDGLLKFPNSGRLYLEQGNVYFIKKQYLKALSYYEKGIDKDPMFPSNYYLATLLFMSSEEEVWGMMYGEIFMLLEAGSERTETVSKLLYDEYQDDIKWNNDTSFSISFTQEGNNITDKNMVNGKLRLNFSQFAYETTLATVAAPFRSLDYENICQMRSAFIDLYYKNKLDKDYPCVLFDYEMKMKKAGHLEAYNHWLMSRGNIEQFKIWVEKHDAEWKSFLEWFKNNRIKLDDNNKFTRERA
ncbi:MAG: hypothetical protein JST82_05640 [Bacteroidetes bacterium]|nr:hypothetical protein [Bacteroidota bacterium]